MAGNMVAVIIPIYKLQPDAIELVSLKQCIRVLKNYPIIFIGPFKLNTTVYEDICQDHIPFNLTLFDDDYFSGIEGYNKLMLSPGFYKTFLDYKYILIHQLDAFVFKDELAYWCMKNYDFIGAPNLPREKQANEIQFLKGYSKLLNAANRIFKTNHKISNVGNGGFSLRKTKACYWLLKILKSKTYAWGKNNEDGFFKYWGNLLYPFFSLPADDIALHFSIEHSPQESLKKLNNELPFGCHAFEKHEPEVWEKYISSFQNLY
jgi:hypothetical protein